MDRKTQQSQYIMECQFATTLVVDASSGTTDNALIGGTGDV